MRLNKALNRVTLVAYLLSLGGLLGVAWLAHEVDGCERETARWVRHTEEVLALNNQVLHMVQQLESSERAYVLTGYPQFTQGLKEQIKEVHARLHDLQVLTGDNALQQQHIAELNDMVVQKLELIEARIYFHDKLTPEKARESIMRSEGREDTELINGMASKIEQEERRLLGVRTTEHQRVIENMECLRNAIVIFSIVFLSVLFWYLGRLRSRKREAEHHVEHLAYHDALTGLPNRRLLLDRLKLNASVATRQTGRFAVLFLDLDGFKKVNDSLGHDSGDILLQQVGQRLQSLLRESDTVARLGGDEFVIGLMLLASIEDAIQVADKVVVEMEKPFTLPNGTANIGTSIGISMYPDHGKEAEDLLMAADKALYQAKSAGKSCHVVYESTMTKTARGVA